MKKTRANRDKWVHIRLTQEEYDLIKSWMRPRTTCQHLSEVLRDILLREPLRVFYRNKSADEFLLVALQLKKELNAIGNNWNQLVKQMYIFKDDIELSALLFGLEVNQKIALAKVEEIRLKMYDIYRLLSDEHHASKPDLLSPILPSSNQATAADQ